MTAKEKLASWVCSLPYCVNLVNDSLIGSRIVVEELGATIYHVIGFDHHKGGIKITIAPLNNNETTRKVFYFRNDDQAENKKDGKCPIDGRMNRPIYIRIDGKRVVAIADGQGHAYKVYGEGFDAFKSLCKPENKYDPDEYEFERGLTGMDF